MTLISTKMLKLLRKKGFGRKILSALGKSVYHVVSYAFVDDKYFLQNAYFGCDIIENAELEIQKVIYLWE